MNKIQIMVTCYLLFTLSNFVVRLLFIFAVHTFIKMSAFIMNLQFFLSTNRVFYLCILWIL